MIQNCCERIIGRFWGDVSLKRFLISEVYKTRVVYYFCPRRILGLKSRVLNKIVYLSEDDEVCFCDESFYKTCISRIANNLPCQEMMVRFTPVDRVDPDSTGGDGDDLMHTVKTSRQFLKTLDHLNRMK